MSFTFLDPFGAFLSLTCTYYSTKEKTEAWLWGLLATFVNAFLYYQKGIYGHLIRDAIYLCLMIFGLYSWLYGGKNKSALSIRPLCVKEGIFLAASVFVSIIVTSYILKTFTTSQIPHWDATTTILSLVAQWLLCRKIIACWLVWLVTDSLTVGLHFYQGIPFHSATHVIYLFLALSGYLQWRKQLTAKLHLCSQA